MHVYTEIDIKMDINLEAEMPAGPAGFGSFVLGECFKFISREMP